MYVTQHASWCRQRLPAPMPASDIYVHLKENPSHVAAMNHTYSSEKVKTQSQSRLNYRRGSQSRLKYKLSGDEQPLPHAHIL